MVYRQFMLQFLKQLIIISIIFILIIVTIISYTLHYMNRQLIEEDFPQYGVESFYHSIKKKNGSYSIDHKFLDKVKERNGFIQLVDTNGYVLYEYHTPKKLPKKYIGGELSSYWTGLLSFPYELIVYKQNQPFILVYGEPKKENQHIKQIQQLGFIKNATLSLPEKEKSWLEKEQAIVQVLDEDGKEIAHFGKTEDLKHTYTVEELIFKIAYPNRYNQQMSLYFDKEKKQTWLLHLPNEKIAGNEPKIYQVVISVIGIGILLWMCVIIFVAYQYSKRMGKPLHDLTTWVNQLANAEYRTESMEATMKKNKNKKMRKVYEELFQSVNTLTNTLKRNDLQREQLEKEREEWVAGISHDLKTPLSSIKGYGQILASDDYEWKASEVQEFSKTIVEKSNYMEALIQDLTITFALKNNAVKFEMEKVDIVELIRRAVVECINHDPTSSNQLSFHTSCPSFFIETDEKWLFRVLQNIIMNALTHNPPNTKVGVNLQMDMENKLLQIFVEDNGNGMDDETIACLFMKYYRGTNTDQSPYGTGLGMNIAWQLVKLLDGEIFIESQVGIGTKVTIEFPI